ncbi:lytic transglycosylase domain-containing protein [Streptomyces sp. NPDC006872]|uniref:lytic transglycosylase domain-containing protein n=1 Tax=Streptomyces sp. NPDC006872 TaxID=3155720 RepID=UPI00340306D6
MASGVKASTVIAAAAGGLGFLAAPLGVTLIIGVILVVGGLAVLLFPIVLIFMFFHGLSFSGLGSLGDPYTGLTDAEELCERLESVSLQENPDAASNRASAIITGDGRGKLELSPPDSTGGGGNAPCTVPTDLYSAIQDAGGICDAIGPVVIAAQIEYESGFDSRFVGPNGAQGISQVPREVFTRFAGEEADPFEAKKSIDVQAKYLCELSAQMQDSLDRQEVTGNVLDLTLTAYDVGVDAVRAAGGVPATDDSQAYIVGVRTWFASMEGVGPVPRKLSDIPALHDDNGERADAGPATP